MHGISRLRLMKVGSLVKWGNSVGLPKPIREGMKLKAVDKIRIVLEDDRIYIEKSK
jgi:antitoxin component of MazEF toxin-antitoxin module